jgi:hypothetical protein
MHYIDQADIQNKGEKEIPSVFLIIVVTIIILVQNKLELLRISNDNNKKMERVYNKYC